MKIFLQQQFDKLLLSSLLFVFMGMILHIFHQPGLDPKAFEWAENGFSAVMGALLMLITGVAKSAQQALDVQPVAPAAPTTPKPNTPAAS